MNYLFFFLYGLLGLCSGNLRKFISLRRKGNMIDETVTVRWYLKRDIDVLAYQFLVIIIGLVSWGAITFAWPWIDKYGTPTFILIGAVGSEWLNAAYSKAEKEVVDRILNFKKDEKTV